MIYLKIFEFLKSVFSKIGLSGFLILALLGIVGFEYISIKHKDETISEKVTIIDGLKKDILIQNDSIDAANQEQQRLLDRIAIAQSKNSEITVKYLNLLKIINRRPIATNCPDAINEVKNSALQNAQIWNSGEIK